MCNLKSAKFGASPLDIRLGMLAGFLLLYFVPIAQAAVGTVSTVAGKLGTSGYSDAVGTSAKFDGPRGIAVDADTLYVTDAGNRRVRKIVAGTVTTVAGTGADGYADGSGAAATFHDPSGIAVDGTKLYVTDLGNDIMRRIDLSTTSNAVTTWIGKATINGATDGVGTNARLENPAGLALSADGSLLFLAEYSDKVRKISTATATTSLLAGSSTSGSANGVGAAATFNSPFGLALSPDGSTVYLADGDNHLIRQIVVSTKAVTTLAGTAGSPGSTDGIGTAARFNTPRDVAMSSDGSTLYVADKDNHVIRAINLASKAVTTFAGTSGSSGTSDGMGAAARFNSPFGLAVSTNGNTMYVADNQNHAIRAVVIGQSSPPPLAPPPSFPPQPPSPSLPLPPGAPGEALVHILIMNATIAGTVTTFDANEYKDKLATFIGGALMASDIKLTVVAASVLVTSEIYLSSATLAAAAKDKLSKTTPTELTAALGVTVESLDPPSVVQRMGTPMEAGLPGFGIALIVTGVIVVLIILILITFVVLKKKKALRPQFARTSNATPTKGPEGPEKYNSDVSPAAAE